MYAYGVQSTYLTKVIPDLVSPIAHCAGCKINTVAKVSLANLSLWRGCIQRTLREKHSDGCI